MKNAAAAKLTAAFEAGKAAARGTIPGDLSARLKFQGKARDFFESGFFTEQKKVEAELRAWYESDEYKAQCEEDAQLWSLLNRALESLDLGDLRAATAYMNKSLGL